MIPGLQVWVGDGSKLDRIVPPVSSGGCIVYKPSDEARTNATFVEDGDLRFAMEANKRYAFSIGLFFLHDVDSRCKWLISGPNLPESVMAIATGVRDNMSNQLWSRVIWEYGTSVYWPLSASARIAYTVQGVIENGPNAGEFTLEWAPNSPLGTGLTLYRGSFIEYREF